MRPPFLLYLLKPSHYDDEGYLIQWRWSWIPGLYPVTAAARTAVARIRARAPRDAVLPA